MSSSLAKFLQYAAPIGLAFIPGIGPVMAGMLSGGITGLATGSLQKGLMAGLMTGGLGAGLGSLTEAAGAAGTAAGGTSAAGEMAGVDAAQEAATEAAMQTPYENALVGATQGASAAPSAAPAAEGSRLGALKDAVSSGNGSALSDAFLSKNGFYAGVGGLGMASADAQEEAKDAQWQRYNEREARRMDFMSRPAPGPAPMPSFNYEDPYESARFGRKTPYLQGYRDGGAVNLDAFRVGSGFAQGGAVDEEDINGNIWDEQEHQQKIRTLRAEVDGLKSYLDSGKGFQADVRRLDNVQVDAWGRTTASPDAEWFGDRRSTSHARGQQHIDHINARALQAAKILKKKGTLEGSGYEEAPEAWDAWFGPGSFKQDFMKKKGFASGGYVPNTGTKEHSGLTDQAFGGGFNDFLLNNNDITQAQYNWWEKWRDPLQIGERLSPRSDSFIGKLLGMSFADGGLATLPGMDRDIHRRRSGAAMLRRIYPDKKSALADMRTPDSPIAKMGITNANDPLLSAAFPEDSGIGRLVTGPGDGKSDSIPAVIDGSQPAALSSGEFVIPADAVSALGRGSNEAGARKLQMMVNKVKPKRSEG